MYLGDSYIDIAENAKSWVKQVIELCAYWDGGVIYHCFLGKDRAGINFSTASWRLRRLRYGYNHGLLPSMICLRRKYESMNPEFLPKNPRASDYKWGFFGSVPESMDALLCHLTERYGGVAGYLIDCGVSAKAVDALRYKLLEKPD